MDLMIKESEPIAAGLAAAAIAILGNVAHTFIVLHLCVFLRLFYLCSICRYRLLRAPARPPRARVLRLALYRRFICQLCISGHGCNQQKPSNRRIWGIARGTFCSVDARPFMMMLTVFRDFVYKRRA